MEITKDETRLSEKELTPLDGYEIFRQNGYMTALDDLYSLLLEKNVPLDMHIQLHEGMIKKYLEYAGNR